MQSDAAFWTERRAAISLDAEEIGIDFVDVVFAADGVAQWLVLHFVPTTTNVAQKQEMLAGITAANVLIAGGAGAAPTSIRVTSVDHDLDGPLTLRVVFTQLAPGAGDFPTYTLRLVNVPGLDPFFAQVTFSLTSDQMGVVDPLPPPSPPSVPPAGPEIDYLARDYASVRQLMLDRLSVLLPDWPERSPADLMVALVEVLAYAADQLSYYQDAVATEAYLGTARRRISAHRHARLLDYAMHDGCNARVWVWLNVTSSVDGPSDGVQLLTGDGPPTAPPLDPIDEQQALAAGAQVFKPLQPFALDPAHNQISIYTWGAREWSLPQGATSATLCDDGPAGADPASLARRALRNLDVGDVLVFEEVVGPATGNPEDADPTHHHAVRLTGLTRTDDQLGGMLTGRSGPVPVVDVEWAPADALPFPLWVAARTDGRYLADVSLAHGNVVLADHGRKIDGEVLPTVPVHGTYRPALQQPGLTFTVPYDDEAARALPAVVAAAQDPRAAVPAITLTDSMGARWTVRRDLLSSDRFARDFVIEMDDDGTAFLRFGDGVQGRQPAPGLTFTASYRVGSGPVGNVGIGTIRRVLTTELAIVGVINPLVASGGTAPESVEQVRLGAPWAFHTQERGASAADYVEAARSFPGVRDAAATLRWTGSWYTAFIAVTRAEGRAVDATFTRQLRDDLQRFRIAGYDLQVQAATYVPLDIALTIRVAPGAFAAAVEQQLLAAFSNLDLGGGQRGFFAPGSFTFGQLVYLRQVIAAALAVPGVVRVDATRFQRWGCASQGELERGWIAIGPIEIARLDNDPAAVQNGTISFDVQGGR
jgi:hypothetical protein